MSDWITFFDSDHAIYVNARHKQVHAIITGDGMLDHINDGDRVLDYGCGEAAYAERLLRKAGQLTLCEAAPTLRERLAQRVAHHRNIAVLSPEAVAALPDGSFDVVIMHSVSQYLSPKDLGDLLAVPQRAGWMSAEPPKPALPSSEHEDWKYRLGNWVRKRRKNT